MDGSDPVANYRAIRDELSRYSDLLANKPEIIVLSKVDLLGDEADRAAAVELVRDALGGADVLPISAASGWGLDTVLERCWQAVEVERAAQPSRA